MNDFNIDKIREDFPILKQKINGKPLIYLDNAATTQKPQSVIDAISDYYKNYNANVHRGLHHLSELATDAYETARQKSADFINARDAREIVFVRGTTEAINLVAHSFLGPNLKENDEVLITHLEHHSNIVPWQLLCKSRGAILKVVPMDNNGELDLKDFDKLFSKKTKMFALGHISNALGTINPIKALIDTAHAHDVPVLIDGAQGAPHVPIDVIDLDCDFYAFSGHKMYGPTGIGVLYAKAEYLEKMIPYQGGGEMIKQVTFDSTVYNDIPHKFEAGTPNIVGAIGFASAIDYLSQFDRNAMLNYETNLLNYAIEKIKTIDNIKLYSQAKARAGALSFILNDVHAHDVGTILNTSGVAVRSGHHCAMPAMNFFNVPAMTRASFGIYNTRGEVDNFITALSAVREVFV